MYLYVSDQSVFIGSELLARVTASLIKLSIGQCCVCVGGGGGHSRLFIGEDSNEYSSSCFTYEYAVVDVRFRNSITATLVLALVQS